ncbi:MAG TPA: lipocalin family protein [Steroidobacteraceae bacterium]|jgi:apolipoprotein D and lipocalin family protein|nr:lipocalin family protein [Steroidobacteraceae bacterium]
MRIVSAALLSTLLLPAFLSGCASKGTPVQTAQHVDLKRYMGDWFVIANIPYFAEKNCVDSIESYSLRSDGRIDNWFQCRKKSFDAPLKKKATAIATVQDSSSNAVWTVRFLKVISTKYLILDVDPNYQWAAVGHPSRKYGWIFARGKSLPDKTYDAILRKFASQGYDTTKFVKVPQQSTTNPR